VPELANRCHVSSAPAGCAAGQAWADRGGRALDPVEPPHAARLAPARGQSERLKHKKEAWALRDELDLWTARVHSGETPAEDLVKWACTIEPHLEGWLKAAEVADG
jgi:hypothetical protein